MSQFVLSGAGGKFFLSTFLYGEFGNRRRALSNWESSRGQCLLFKRSKYFSPFPLPVLNFYLLHPFLYHKFLPPTSCFVSCGTWRMHSLSHLSPFCSLSSPPSLWCPGLLQTGSFTRGGSGSLSSSGRAPSPPGQALLRQGPGTALQWWQRTSSAGSSGQCSTLDRGEMSPIMALQLCCSETTVLGVLGSPLLTCFSLQGVPWRCHGASPMGGLKPSWRDQCPRGFPAQPWTFAVGGQWGAPGRGGWETNPAAPRGKAATRLLRVEGQQRRKKWHCLYCLLFAFGLGESMG